MTDEIERVYIAGAITHATPAEREMFELAADQLRALGHMPWIPPEVQRNPMRGTVIPGTEDSLEGWMGVMERDIAFLASRATAICVLPTWRKSRGARLEIFIAYSLGKKYITLDWTAKQVETKLLCELMQVMLFHGIDADQYRYNLPETTT